MISFGFAARHWQQIEAGRPITVTTLLRICEVFRVPAARMLKGLDKRYLLTFAVGMNDFRPRPDPPKRAEILHYPILGKPTTALCAVPLANPDFVRDLRPRAPL